MSQGRNRCRSRARGIGTVEFALASLLFLPLALGTIDLGRAVFAYSALTDAVRAGARSGQVEPGNVGEIATQVRAGAVGIEVRKVTVAPSAAPCDPGACRLTVSADARFDPITAEVLNAILGGALPGGFTLSTSATVEVE